MGEIRKVLLILGVLAFALSAAGMATGCGGDEASGEQETAARQERLYPWLKGPTRQFLIRGGDNAVQIFGREAARGEREQASAVIKAWMKARAAQDWAKDCSYFSQHQIHQLITTDAMVVSHGAVKNCAQGLAFFGHKASGSYKNTLAGPIASLRVKGVQGFAQYHGNDGHDWVVALEREGGKWWIAASSPVGRSS